MQSASAVTSDMDIIFRLQMMSGLSIGSKNEENLKIYS